MAAFKEEFAGMGGIEDRNEVPMLVAGIGEHCMRVRLSEGSGRQMKDARWDLSKGWVHRGS